MGERMSKLKNNVMPNLIALMILFMLILNVYTTYAKRQKEMIFEQPEVEIVYDRSREFDQKKYWLQKNHGGETMICSQRTGIYPQYYKHSEIRCHKAKKVTENREHSGECFYANGAMLCKKEGRLEYQNATKVCGKKVIGVLLGKIKKVQENGRATSCFIIKTSQ